MKVTRIELEGRPGRTALLRPDLAGVYATVEIYAPAGVELFVTTAHAEDLRSTAALLHRRLEGFEGSAGDLAEYLAALELVVPR